MRRPAYNSRLKKLKIIVDPLTKKKRFETPKNIDIPVRDSDLYVEIKKDMKLYKIANELYGDPTLWWVICLANSMKHSFDIEKGVVLRIPKFKENVIGSL